jgi:hypothetical protein
MDGIQDEKSQQTMEEGQQMVVVKQYRRKGENVLLFHEGHFLLLPGTEVEAHEGGVQVEEEALAAAFDVTPDLPLRILQGAWKKGCVFYSEIDVNWAAGVARGLAKQPRLPNLSALDIVNAFAQVFAGG